MSDKWIVGAGLAPSVVVVQPALTPVETLRHIVEFDTIIDQCGHLPEEYASLLDRVCDAWEVYKTLVGEAKRARLSLLLESIQRCAHVG